MMPTFYPIRIIILIESKVREDTMAESGDCDLEETPKDNLDGSRDGHDAEWDVAGAYESNNSGLTADIGINDALHSFQGRSDFLLEKYVHKVNSNLSGL